MALAKGNLLESDERAYGIDRKLENGWKAQALQRANWQAPQLRVSLNSTEPP